jgi:hypothetical protein
VGTMGAGWLNAVDEMTCGEQVRTMGAGWLKAVDEMTWWRASEDDVCWMAQGCRRDDMLEGK